MNDLVFDIIRIAIFATFLVITKYLVPSIRLWLKSRISENQYSLLIAVIKSAVQALEQEFKGETGQGATKKEQVTVFVKDYCETHNINMTDEQISTLIESAVYGVKNAKE